MRLRARRRRPVVLICGKIESEIAELADEEKAAFLKDMGMEEPGLEPRDPRGLRAARACRPTSPPARSRSAPGRSSKGAKAPAGRRRDPHRLREGLHPRRGLSATTTSMKHKSEAGRQDAGKLRLEGKEYVVQDGDIMHFRFAV